MTSRRNAKVAQAVLECISSCILYGLKDPRVRNVTVIRAEVASDLRTAKIYVSVLGDEKRQALTMRGLESARGFLQAKVAERLETRYTPVLKFVLDPGVKLSLQTSAILKELQSESSAVKIDERAAPERSDSEVDTTEEVQSKGQSVTLDSQAPVPGRAVDPQPPSRPEKPGHDV